MKTLEEQWAAYDRGVVPPGAPALQHQEVKRGFYAGAWAFFCSLLETTGPEWNEDAGANAVETLRSEILGFRKLVATGRDGYSPVPPPPAPGIDDPFKAAAMDLGKTIVARNLPAYTAGANNSGRPAAFYAAMLALQTGMIAAHIGPENALTLLDGVRSALANIDSLPESQQPRH